jgi:hypothetical protein
MFILTHTYLLQKLLADTGINCDLDVYVYNIAPDLLTIHPAIDSKHTHNIKRQLQTSVQFPKAAYVMYHLLVDDFAHYGSISSGADDQFNPDSQGYSYITGKPLISSILEFHKSFNNEISYDEAVYRSHGVIELLYDVVILDHLIKNKTIELLDEAINFTVENKMQEFAATMNWLYGFSEDQLREVFRIAHLYTKTEKMKKLTNIEGRIRFYFNKFGLKIDNQLIYDSMKNLFLQALKLLEDDEKFLKDTEKSIKSLGWQPPVM